MRLVALAALTTALAALTAACVEPRALILPDTPELRAGRSMLLVWESPSGDVGVAALDLGSDATIPVALPTTDTLTALVYPLGLDAFHLAPGPIPLPS
ncbi:hypothetical protein L6R52_23500, partial [Myxococcota bacterium]|nr:hypothetical protein [Myxococcota bacterium]